MRGIVGKLFVGELCVGLACAIAVGCTQEVDRGEPFGSGSQGSIGSIGSTTPMGDPDDDGSSSGEGDTGDDTGNASSPASGPADDSASSTMTGATTMPADTGETGSGDPVLDACLEIAVNECETCACELCLDPLYACQQDPGCVAMRDCAEQTGCAGVDCLEPCGAVIDMYGGAFGSSGMLALALSDCLTASCPSCF